MGFVDRLSDVVTGFGGALQAPIGLIKDFAIAPFRDDEEFDGLINTLVSRTKTRMGQALESSMGPDEGLGALLGGVPQAVRRPAKTLLGPIERGMETVYREGVAEPLSTAYLLNQRSGSPVPNAGGALAIFQAVRDPASVREAYRQAQNISPGQALSYHLLAPGEIDEAELARVAGTDAFEAISGLSDALVRFTLDPTVVAGKAAMAASRYLVQPIRSAADINKAMSSGRVAKFRQATMGKSAAEIRDQFFASHKNGALIASVLADAGDDAARFDVTLRAVMGDMNARAFIEADDAALASRIERLTAQQNEILALHSGGRFAFTDPDRLRRVEAEIDALHPEEQRLARADAAFATLAQTPRVSASGRLRTAVTRSEVYQHSPWAAPLRRTFNMVPHQWVPLHDVSGDVQLERMLKQAGMDFEQRGGWRSQYMAAMDPGQRAEVLRRAESDAVRVMAERAGMTRDEIEALVTQSRRYRGQTEKALASRTYDGEGRSSVRFRRDDGVWEEVNLPLWVTQEVNFMPITDMAEVRRVTTRIGRFRARHPNSDIPTDMLDGFMGLWKPSVLLRVGWPVRVVFDEQLRIMAKVGALSQAASLGKAFYRNVSERLENVPKQLRGLGEERSVRGYRVAPMFGTPADTKELIKLQVSSRGSFESTGITTAERRELERLRQAAGETAKTPKQTTAQWRSIAPDEADYGRAWEQAVNLQIGQDAVGRMVLGGADANQVLRWLKSTPEGRKYARRIPGRKEHLDDWADKMVEQVDAYLPTPALRSAALQGKAKANDLVAQVADASRRPVVHGEALAHMTGKSILAQRWNDLIGGMYKALGSAPTDVLSRNRFFDQIYQAETKRLIDLLDEQRPGGLTAGDITMIESKARTYAMGETKKYLYDLRESSELAETLRFIAPFFNAWQEVITVWAGLAVENPAFVARARMAWSAPEKAGLVVDENGNRVDHQGNATNPLGERVDPGSERFILMRVPEWAQKALPGLRHAGSVRFAKDSLNMVLSGPPGVGPVVQLPVNEIVKDRPELEESLKFILPFGTTQELQSMLLPATAKRIRSRAGGEGDQVYANAVARIYLDKLMDIQTGKREQAPAEELWAEAKRDANSLFNLRTFVSFISPVALQFNSPYQHYIDAYRALREADPENADERFLQEFGDEYFAATQSLSKSMDGVPPTLEGFMARKKYRDLIEAEPELGGWIVGAEGAGEFSRSVYDFQRSTQLKPMSPHNQRASRSFEEIVSGPDVRLGWIEYRKGMDLLHAELEQRGLANMQVKAASDLAAIKKALISNLSEKYPAWYEQFSVTDRNKTANRLKAMRAIAGDSRMEGRPDMQGVRDYFQVRDAMVAELANRKASGAAGSLRATDNRDLALLWEGLVNRIIERNPAFSDTYYRWLERDTLEDISGDQ